MSAPCTGRAVLSAECVRTSSCPCMGLVVFEGSGIHAYECVVRANVELLIDSAQEGKKGGRGAAVEWRESSGGSTGDTRNGREGEFKASDRWVMVRGLQWTEADSFRRVHYHRQLHCHQDKTSACLLKPSAPIHENTRPTTHLSDIRFTDNTHGARMSLGLKISVCERGCTGS